MKQPTLPRYPLPAFIATVFFSMCAHAQEAGAPKEAKDFWWNDKPESKDLPLPIVPDQWLVVPEDANKSLGQVFVRYLLDPESEPPTMSKRSEDSLTWQARDSKSPASVLAAYTCINSQRDEVRMARLTGAESLFVNGEGFVGDAENRSFRGVPVSLKKGDNHLYVLGIAHSFELELWCPRTRAVLATWDVAWPGEMPTADDFAYPVFNASTEEADNLHVHYGHAVVEGSSCKPEISDWRCGGGGMLPLGLRMAGSYFYSMMSECDPVSDEQPAILPICVYVCGDPDPDQQMLRRPPASELKASRASRSVRAPSVLAASPFARVGPEPVFVTGAGQGIGRARFDQEIAWYRTWITPEAISDETLTTVTPNPRGTIKERQLVGVLPKKHFVLYGNADTNKAWTRFVTDEFPIRVREGLLTVGGNVIRRADICGWFALKTKDGKSVVVVADTGARGAQLGYLVQPLFSAAEGLDYAFWDAGGEGGIPRLIESGKLPP